MMWSWVQAGTSLQGLVPFMQLMTLFTKTPFSRALPTAVTFAYRDEPTSGCLWSKMAVVEVLIVLQYL